MNDKVAAAVERLRERFAHVSGQALSYESINVPASDVETILAELGRLSGGEPVAMVPVHPTYGPLWSETIPTGSTIFRCQNYPWQNLYTRPPALGELSDERLIEMYDSVDDAIQRAAASHYVSNDQTQSWEAKRKEVIAKAAREFWGKVDG